MSRSVAGWIIKIGAWGTPALVYPLVYHPETVRRWLAPLGRLGRSGLTFLTSIYPSGVGAAVVCLVCAALIPVFFISRRPAWYGANISPDISSTPAPEETSSRPVFRRFSFWSVVLLVCLGGVTSRMLAEDRPPDRAAMLWIGCLVLGWVSIRRKLPGQSGERRFLTKGEAVFIGVAAVAELVLIARDLTHWRWAGTPDESHFFLTAKAFFEGRLRDRFILSEHGVFGYHPVLSSYYQVVFMKIFGENIRGWRLSSAAVPALAFPGLYVWVRELFNRRAAMIALVLFGTTPLVAGFSHFGYNNVQVYLITAWALGLGAWGLRKNRPVAVYGAGIVAGLGFYTYYPARIVIPLVIIQAFCLRGVAFFRREHRRLFGALLLGIFIAVLPVLMHFDEIMAHMVQQTAITGGRQISAGELGSVLKKFREKLQHPDENSRFLQHWTLALLYGIRYKTPHHFQSNPVMNPVSGILFLIGAWMCIRFIRHPSGRFMVIGFFFSAFVVGAISQYDRPPLTRLLFLSPFTAVFGAVALDVLAGDMEGGGAGGRRKRLIFIFLIVVLLCSAVWDVLLLYRDIYMDHHGYGDGTTSELVRMLPYLPEDAEIVFIQRKDTYMECVDLIMDAYGQGERFRYLRPYNSTAKNILASLEPPFVVFYDLKRRTEIFSLRHLLEQRFPAAAWRNSDPGKPWNLPYLVVTSPSPGSSGGENR